jgi:MarR family transcriptional regulator for hemolysin
MEPLVLTTAASPDRTLISEGPVGEAAMQWPRRRMIRVQATARGAPEACLVHLALHGELNPAALAQSLGIRLITLVRLLDPLEAAGFVERMSNPDDRRAHVLALTAKALPIIEYIRDLTRKTDDDLQLGIPKPEASQLRALLRRIRSNLKDRPGEIPSSEPLRTRGPP